MVANPKKTDLNVEKKEENSAKKAVKSTKESISLKGESPSKDSESRSLKSGSMGSIGSILQKIREDRNENLSDVSRALRISSRYLHAIEEMRKDELPERVYALGFVRSYAQYLGVDPEKSILKFKEEFYAQDASGSSLSIPKPAKEAERPKKKLILLTLMLFVLLLVVAKFIIDSQQDPVSELSSSSQTATQTPSGSIDRGAEETIRGQSSQNPNTLEMTSSTSGSNLESSSNVAVSNTIPSNPLMSNSPLLGSQAPISGDNTTQDNLPFGNAIAEPTGGPASP